MRNYTNGYQDKIDYWKSQMTIRRDSGDVEGVVHALRKLNYFLNRQVEVYGKSI